MSKFITYEGETHTKRKGRGLSQETKDLRDALNESANSGKVIAIPGTSKADHGKWAAKIYLQAKIIGLRANVSMTDTGDVAFKAHGESATKPAAAPTPAPKPARKPRASAKK